LGIAPIGLARGMNYPLISGRNDHENLAARKSLGKHGIFEFF
jgi:hypothetical protein